MSLINSLCSELDVTVHKAEKAYTTHFKDGRLNKEEIRENQERVTGTTVEGKLDPDLFPEGIDVQELEQWFIGVKSVHQQLRLFYNGKEV
jgi:DNA gyrase/topoisomerase IV subunit B